MNAFSSIKRRNVRKKELAALLSESGWIPIDLKLSNSVSSLENEDGRLLILIDRHWGVLYESIIEYHKLMEMTKALYPEEPQHILKGRLPYGKEFPAHVDEIVRDLAEALNLPIHALDYTSASLGKLDPKLKRRGREACLNSPVIFGGLVAYTMEIARRRKGWRWVMYKHPQHDVWEPWLSDDQGWHFNSWSALYDIFAETEYGLSVSGMDNEGIMQRRRAPSE